MFVYEMFGNKYYIWIDGILSKFHWYTKIESIFCCTKVRHNNKEIIRSFKTLPFSKKTTVL